MFWWWWCCRNCCCWCCWARTISFCLRSSSTLRCEFECFVRTNVGLAAGLYSGTSRPDLYLTPQALHSVFGPMGPVRHCGVLSVAQWRHLRPSPPLPSPLSFFLGVAFAGFFVPEWVETGETTSVSEDDVVGDRTRRRDAQLHGGPRDLLLRALAGTDTSELNIGLFLVGSEWNPFLVGSEWNPRAFDTWSFLAFMPDISCIFCRSSLENDSSTKFESHSSSAISSYCFQN